LIKILLINATWKRCKYPRDGAEGESKEQPYNGCLSVKIEGPMVVDGKVGFGVIELLFFY
jgi:hypothetical protein